MTNPACRPVLYVEDEEDDVFLVRFAYERAAITHPLRIAKDGKQALDYLLGHGEYADRQKYPLPFMILLDLNLPNCNGFEVLDRARQHPALKNLPVFVFTSSREQKDIDRARELGATDYFVKMADLAHLSSFLAEVVARGQECDEPRGQAGSGSSCATTCG